MKKHNLIYLKNIKKFRKKYYRDENFFSIEFYKDFCKFRENVKEVIKKKAISKDKNIQKKDQIFYKLTSFKKKS